MARAIQMVDLLAQYNARKSEFDAAIEQVIQNTSFINGPEVAQLQSALSTYLNSAYTITCGNGTDALTIALWALDLPAGSEVITTDFTFIATAEAIARVGLIPVVVDINPETFTIDPDAIEQAITPNTKAIMPVHLFGQAADMNRIMEIADAHNLYVIEDCAQSFGAEYTFTDSSTKKLGTIGTIGCTSFFPSKNLGCFGDGGAIFTQDETLAKKIKNIANHGSSVKYYHSEIGVNSRLDTIQAAILLVKLAYIDEYNSSRKQAAEWYDSFLSNESWLQTPVRQAHSTHVFHQYTIRLMDENNTELQNYLKSKGIPSMIYYPLAMHKQEALQQFSPQICLQSLKATTQVLSLPMHPELTKEEVEYISNSIKSFKYDQQKVR